MSRVVLRCPNCGTTRGAPGRCDACHDAEVKYFCTNHSPGRWLTGPTCDTCGGYFGERRPAPPPVAKPTTASPRSEERRPPPVLTERPRRSPWRPREADYRSPEAPASPSTADVLAEILRRTGSLRRPPPTLGPPPGIIMLGGCFRVAFVLFMLAIVLLMMLAGGVVMQLSSGYW